MTARRPPDADDPLHGMDAPGLPGEPPIDAESIDPVYWRAFGLVAFMMNRFIVDHVLRATRHFDNDAETMILFGTVAHLNVAHLMPPGSSPTQVLSTDGRVPDAQRQLRAVRLRDLEQITGRPRETIRRKLERLEAEGRLLRRPDGYVIDVETVDPTMRALSVDGVRRFMETSRAIESILRETEKALAQERKR